MALHHQKVSWSIHQLAALRHVHFPLPVASLMWRPQALLSINSINSFCSMIAGDVKSFWGAVVEVDTPLASPSALPRNLTADYQRYRQLVRKDRRR